MSDERIGQRRALAIGARAPLHGLAVELQQQRLIDKASAGIAVLGLTTSQTLEHTATIFEESTPAPCERAAIELSEKVSELPVVKEDAAEYMGNAFHIPTKDTKDILEQCESIGFFDTEDVSGQKIYFNGNLFRREEIAKAKAVISSLSTNDERKVLELSAKLASAGCISKPEVRALLGDVLYSKLCSIGFID